MNTHDDVCGIPIVNGIVIGNNHLEYASIGVKCGLPSIEVVCVGFC